MPPLGKAVQVLCQRAHVSLLRCSASTAKTRGVSKDAAKIEVFLYPCKLLAFFLLCDEQEVVLLTTLYEQILVVEKVCSGNFLIKSGKLLLVERYATTLSHLAHLAL